jgi:hypothetical protein
MLANYFSCSESGAGAQSFCYRSSMPKLIATLLTLALSLPVLAKDTPKSAQAAPIRLTRARAQWAERTLHHLTLEEKIGQVFMIWCRASFLNVENPE